MKFKWSYSIYLISLYALFLCYFVVIGIYGFIDNPESPNRVENLYLIGLASIQGLILFSIFVFLSYVMRRKVKKLAFFICLIPFIGIGAGAVFAHVKGVPW